MSDTAGVVKQPCPFCGGTDIMLGIGGTPESPKAWISCQWCQADGPIDDSETGAWLSWNRRAQ